MSRRRVFLVALAVAAVCGGATAALAGDGAIADAVRQAFGGDVKATRADGSAAQAGDVPTKQSNGSIAYAAGGGVANPLTADLSVGGNLLTSTDGTAQLELSNTFAALRDTTGSSEVTASATSLDLYGHSQVDVGIGGGSVGTFTSSGFALGTGKTLTGGTLTWTSWTPTGSWSTNTTYTGYRARIGNDLLARVKITLSGDPGAGALTVNLPSGLTIDTTAHASPAVSAAALGYGQGLDAGTLAYPLTVSYHSSDTLVVINALTAGGTYAALSNASAVSDVPFDWQSGDSLGVEFRVTCTGW